MAAADALSKMTAQRHGAAPDNGIEHPAMHPCKVRVLFLKSVARCANDVGHLEGGPAHRLIFLLDRFTSLERPLSLPAGWELPADAVWIDAGKVRYLILAWPSRTWMEARSAPASSKCVAKLCRSKWGATELLMPTRLPAYLMALQKTLGVMGTSARQLFTVPGEKVGLGLHPAAVLTQSAQQLGTQ